MALKTEIEAVTITDDDENGAQTTAPGISVRANMDALAKMRTDMVRLAQEIHDKLPAGTAKTNVATILTNIKG